MSESYDKQSDRDPGSLSLEKKADILHGNFKHYYGMAMDHHTKAGTTSTILLIVVGAILGLVGLDNTIGGMVDFASGLAVSVLGVFGAVWAWKQHERYHYWEHIAYEYQKELIKIMPELKIPEKDGEYDRAAKDAAAKIFGSVFAKRIQDRSLWIWLHFMVVIIGIVLMFLST